MGSRGSFLKNGGFKNQNWKAVGYTESGIKILEPVNKSGSWGMPERSNTPNTQYIMYDKDGIFKNFRIYDENRNAKFEIDYHTINGNKVLHMHKWVNGDRINKKHIELTKEVFDKYKHLFKGVKL